MGPRVCDVRGYGEMSCDVTAGPGGNPGAQKGREDREGKEGKFKLLSTPGVPENLNRKLFDISILPF